MSAADPHDPREQADEQAPDDAGSLAPQANSVLLSEAPESDGSQLYQAILLEHSKHPRHFHELANPTHRAACDNPVCGDHVSVQLRLEAGCITEIGFQGESCAIARASASMMSESVRGLSPAQVCVLSQSFSQMLRSSAHVSAAAAGHPAHPCAMESADPPLGALEAFAVVARYPVRVHCAELPWRALRQALGV